MKKRTPLLLACICVSVYTFAQATFAPVINYPIHSDFADHLTAGDFNHDGMTDIAVATWLDSFQVRIYYQSAFGGPLDIPAVRYRYPHAYPGVKAIASGDINNDGRDDIAIAFSDSIGIYYQDTSGTMKPLVSMWCHEGEVAVLKVADVDMDGFHDIVAVPRTTSSDVIVYYGREGSGFTQINYPTPYTGNYHDDLRVGKVGRDTLNSLVRMSAEFSNAVTRLRIRTDRTLDSTFIHSIPVGSGPIMSGVEIGRFTDTAINQIAATYGGNVPSSHLAIWVHPDTSYFPDSVIAVSDIPQSLAAGHLSDAPAEQLVILHGGFSMLSIVDFTYGISHITVPCPNLASPDGVVIADLNHDGKLDIALANTHAGLSILLNTTIPPAAVSHLTPYGANIRMYPNPFTKDIAIEAPGKFFATIYTMVGKAIATEAGTDKLTFSNGLLPPGMYFLVVEDGNRTTLCRSAIIKQ